ncbi:hypothetical protein [Cerasicoccus maritimus]|uniref:hypothetical protein n=1 Tax=Cerasicoccus maritimus TaxID=490089 RepID=UPI002852BFD4|nr:hypothetical protein [Cerasicoccus maritimus]
MKSFAQKTLLAAAALSAGSFANAAPLVSIGDSVDVFFNGSTNVQWRSNLFYTDGQVGTTPTGVVVNRPKDSAFVFYVSPGLEINIGRNSNANVSIYFREDFLFYTKYGSQLNTELANLYVDGTYDWGNLQTSAGFSFVQSQQNTATTSGRNFQANLVETDNYRAYLDGDYDISPKAWASAGFTWTRTDYTNNQDFGNTYSDLDTYTLPLSFYWRVTPKLSVGPSFRFRYSDPSSTPGVRPADYFDYFFNVAVRGEVAPKLNLSVNLGYQLRDPNRDRLVSGVPVTQDTRGQFAIDGTAEYAVTPKLMTYATLYHDFGVGAQGQTTTNLGGDIGATYTFNEYISSNAEFGMENSEYQNTTGREDLTTTTSLSVNYTPNVYWQLSVGYYYINNHSTGNFNPVIGSNNTGASFQAHTVNLQATFRY